MLLAPLFALALLQAKPPAPVDAVVAEAMQTGHAAGLALCVLSGGRVVAEGCYGKADLGTGAAVTPKSVFRFSSMSKAMIASAAMLLVREGKLSLDDPLSKYVADAPEAWATIRVRDLLSHTAGLAREMKGYSISKPYTNDELLAMAEITSPLGEPGVKYAYSNIGYFLVGEIVSKAAGEPWAAVVAKRIFAPLGMGTVRTTVEDTPERVPGYVWKEDRFAPAALIRNLRTSGAFMGTIRDMELWAAEQLHPRVLPVEVLKAMWTPTPLKDGTVSDYGFAWELGRDGSIVHSGANPGYSSTIDLFPRQDVAVVVLTNADGFNCGKLARSVARLYFRNP